MPTVFWRWPLPKQSTRPLWSNLVDCFFTLYHYNSCCHHCLSFAGVCVGVTLIVLFKLPSLQMRKKTTCRGIMAVEAGDEVGEDGFVTMMIATSCCLVFPTKIWNDKWRRQVKRKTATAFTMMTSSETRTVNKRMIMLMPVNASTTRMETMMMMAQSANCCQYPHQRCWKPGMETTALMLLPDTKTAVDPLSWSQQEPS